MREWVHVRLSRATVEQLKDLGKKGETYDDIVKRLIRAYRGKDHESSGSA